LLVPVIRDGCAMLFAFVVIRNIAPRNPWSRREFLPLSGESAGK
jgi:hypothetical protein